MNRAELTPKTFHAQLKAIARANPRRTNGAASCKYTAQDGSHCLIGEYLSIHDPSGLPDPSDHDNSRAAYDLLRDLGYSEDVAELASTIQQELDIVYSRDPLTWKQAVHQHRPAREE